MEASDCADKQKEAQSCPLTGVNNAKGLFTPVKEV